ncbi:MAG: ribulokinase [Desulfobacter sp.]
MTEQAVIGIDFGTDAVRAVVADAVDGTLLGQGEAAYPRWQKGRYCDPAANQFRQHPLDHLESMEQAVAGCLDHAGKTVAPAVRAIGVDTTGSTPGPVDQNGRALSMTPGFIDDPDAMFVLWKDHTGVREAEEITTAAKNWGGTDFTRYCGGTYSAEWFWSKILHILRENPGVRERAFSWVEHCDWVTGVLTGITDPLAMRRSRCAAGHKAMWHRTFQGLPPDRFWQGVDPTLAGLTDRLYTQTHAATVPAGTLSDEWAEKFGLGRDVVVGVGLIDAHAGAVGGQIAPGALLKVMGTSTCDMIVAPEQAAGTRTIPGICGQADDSIIPGMVGLEAGQSAFGDIYAWFRDLLAWPAAAGIGPWAEATEADKTAFTDQLIPALSDAAMNLDTDSSVPVSLDWFNGRRTPNANQALKGGISGLTLASSAPALFLSLVESTAFGSRRIAEHFTEQGIEINQVIAVGGVAKKSPLVMQTLADVMGMSIRVARSDQTCALGAAMTAAVAAGIHGDLVQAQAAMGAGFEREYRPDASTAARYDRRYREYLAMGRDAELSRR